MAVTKEAAKRDPPAAPSNGQAAAGWEGDTLTLDLLRAPQFDVCANVDLIVSGTRKERKAMKKLVKIVVNGREKEVEKDELSFAEVVALAFGTPATGDDIIYTVTFHRGQGNKPEGTLVDGDSVKVKEGMVINVSRTDKS